MCSPSSDPARPSEDSRFLFTRPADYLSRVVSSFIAIPFAGALLRSGRATGFFSSQVGRPVDTRGGVIWVPYRAYIRISHRLSGLEVVCDHGDVNL